MEMNQSDDSQTRPCYRCDNCQSSFADHETLVVHVRTNCPKIFQHPSCSTTVAPPPGLSQFGSCQHKLQVATGANRPLAPSRTYLCLENMKSAIDRNKIAYDAFEATSETVENAAAKYREALKQKKSAMKIYNTALQRKNELGTVVSLYEELIIEDVLVKALDNVKTALEAEAISAEYLYKAIVNEKRASEEVAAATAVEQYFFHEAMKTFGEANPDARTQAEFEKLTNLGKVLQASSDTLKKFQEKSKQLEVLVLSLMDRASKCKRITTDQGMRQENNAAEMSDITPERLSVSESSASANQSFVESGSDESGNPSSGFQSRASHRPSGNN